MTVQRPLIFRRRLIKVGNSRAVTLPIEWLEQWAGSGPLKFLSMTINSQGALVLTPAGGNRNGRPTSKNRKAQAVKDQRTH